VVECEGRPRAFRLATGGRLDRLIDAGISGLK